MKLIGVLASASLVATGAAAALIERRGCNADDILRDLRNAKTSAAAVIFCSSYLQSTSTTIVTVTQTLNSETFATSPDVQTSTSSTVLETITAAVTDYLYSAAPTVTVDVSITETTFPASDYLKKAKRSLAPGEPTQFSTVPAARISSACSCFIAQPSPTTITVFSTSSTAITTTATAPPTQTDVIVLLTTLSSTFTLPVEITLPPTSSVAATSTSISVATISPMCSGSQVVSNPGFQIDPISRNTIDWNISTTGDIAAYNFNDPTYFEGNGSALICNNFNSEGTAIFSQQLSGLDTSATYQFAAYIGYNSDKNHSNNITVSVTLGSQILFDTVSICDGLPATPSSNEMCTKAYGSSLITGLIQPSDPAPLLGFVYAFTWQQAQYGQLMQVTLTACD